MEYTIKSATGGVVAADTQSSVAALDIAVVMQSRLCASVMEAATQSRLPIGATQPLLEAMTSGMRNLASSRSDMVAAVSELLTIQKSSSLSEDYFGCPGGPPRFSPEGVHEARETAVID